MQEGRCGVERSDYFKVRDFEDFPEGPKGVSASNTVARLIDGLGSRLYMSLDGLTEEQCSLRPCEGGKTIGEALHHILGLVNWVRMHVYGQQMTRPESYLDQGWATLAELEKLRKHFVEITDEQLGQYELEGRPWWSFVSMPLSDALHHEGEVRLLRMQIGNPAE